MSSWAVAKLGAQPREWCWWRCWWSCLAVSLANDALLALDIPATGQQLGLALPWGPLSPPVSLTLVLPPAPVGAVPGCWVPWVPGPRCLPRVELC